MKQCDFVTLHVPKTDLTKGMIGERELSLMKKGACLLNASRGSVVDLEGNSLSSFDSHFAALERALKSGHLGGAYIDVYPVEPEVNTSNWVSNLQGLPNVILTPHIGGSTEEAQYAIGCEVADKIIKIINSGSTLTAVNFPSIDLPDDGLVTTHRVLNIHKNVPGVLKATFLH